LPHGLGRGRRAKPTHVRMQHTEEQVCGRHPQSPVQQQNSEAVREIWGPLAFSGRNFSGHENSSFLHAIAGGDSWAVYFLFHYSMNSVCLGTLGFKFCAARKTQPDHKKNLAPSRKRGAPTLPPHRVTVALLRYLPTSTSVAVVLVVFLLFFFFVLLLLSVCCCTPLPTSCLRLALSLSLSPSLSFSLSPSLFSLCLVGFSLDICPKALGRPSHARSLLFQ
jgi:hypothetical protein